MKTMKHTQNQLSHRLTHETHSQEEQSDANNTESQEPVEQGKYFLKFQES